MPKTANLNIRLDPEIKSSAEILFARFGITNKYISPSSLDGWRHAF